MVYPCGSGDLIWQGGVFGLTAPSSGGLTANVWQVAVTVAHFCSNPAAFSSVTAPGLRHEHQQRHRVTAVHPVGVMITETITLTTGYPAADVPDLAAG